MALCSDTDLLVYRSNILSFAVSNWDTQRTEAERIVTRVITARWYVKAAPAMGVDPTLTAFDPDKIQGDQLKALACFKSLELIYLELTKDSPEPDGFERQRKVFKELYGEELDAVLGMGLTYDWSGDGTVDQDEVMIQAPRRLRRC